MPLSAAGKIDSIDVIDGEFANTDDIAGVRVGHCVPREVRNC
jgi:hypothetical protein